MKDSNEVESRSSKAIANQPAQLQSKGAALAAPSQARSNISPPSTNQEVVQKQLDLDAELLVLGGQLSFGAKFKGLFGSETSFSKIEKLVKEYSVKKSPATKQTIIAECNAWLTSDSRKSVKDGDDVKKASITRIRNGLKNDEAGAIDLTILSDKVSTTNKIKEAITGEKSTYQKLEQSYLEYQQKLTSYEFTAENVKIIVEAVREVDTLVDLWKTKHPEELGNEKGKEVINIQNNIGKLSMAIKLSDYLSLSIKGIKLSSIKNGIFEAESGEVKINILDNNIKAIVTKPVITENSADWETATLEKSDLKIGSVSIKDLSATIKGKSADYAHTLSAETFDASLENLISVSGEKIEYDSAKKEFKADSAKLALTVLGKPVSGKLARPKVNKEGIDWETASITLPDIKLGTVNIEGLTGTIGGKALDFAYTISSNKFNGKIAGITYSGSEALYDSKTGELSAESAGAEFSLFDKTIKGKINKPKVSSEVIDWESASISVDSLSYGDFEATALSGELGNKSTEYAYKLSAESFTGELVGLSISGTEIAYDSKSSEFSAKSASASINMLRNNVTGTINDLVSSQENGFDWSTAQLKADPGVISFGDNLNFTLPTIIINGKKENYLLLIDNAKASLTIGDLIKTEGAGSLSWDFVGGKSPEIESAEIDVSINSGKSIPGAFLPCGIWPFNISFEFPVAPGAYAGFGFVVGGGIGFTAKGKVVYTKPNKLIFDIEGGPEGFVDFSVFANAGLGHPILLALEAELKATIKAIAHAKTNIKGEATKEGDSYKLNELMAKYDLIAELKAAISFNFNARALYIFKKTLYEIKLAEWDLGEGATSGEFDLINNQGNISDPSTFMNKPNSPFISEKSEYMKNLAVFNEEIEPRANTAGAIEETNSFMAAADRAVSEEEIKAKFELAKAIINATPQELLERKTVLAELKLIKEGTWLILPSSRERRLKQYEDISARITALEVELENIQHAVNAGLEPGQTNDIAPSIRQLFVNLNTMTIAFDDADKYKKLGNK